MKQLISRLLNIMVISALVSIVPFNATRADQVEGLGVGFSLANYPNGTGDDLLDTLAISSNLASNMSIVWSWRNQQNLPFLNNVIPFFGEVGLTTLLQISPTALGNPVPPAGYEKTFLDPQVREKYLQDVETFASFEPEYLILCAEVNLMYHLNPQEFSHYASLYLEAYNLAKSISPDTKVGISMLDVMFIGFRQFNIVNELGPVDVIGVTTYPGKLIKAGTLGVNTIDEFPREWYEIFKLVYPDKPIIVSEIGWSSTTISSPEEQAEFVRAMPSLLSLLEPELTVWTLLHDTEFFQSSNLNEEAQQILDDLGVDPDELFNRFNGMGLLTTEGTFKPAFSDAQQLEFPWLLTE